MERGTKKTGSRGLRKTIGIDRRTCAGERVVVTRLQMNRGPWERRTGDAARYPGLSPL